MRLYMYYCNQSMLNMKLYDKRSIKMLWVGNHNLSNMRFYLRDLSLS